MSATRMPSKPPARQPVLAEESHLGPLIPIDGGQIARAATQPSPLQRKAALRVDQLVMQAGPLGQLEDDPRARMNMLGSVYKTPILSFETPSLKMNAARSLAMDTRAVNKQRAKGGF
jgi:hypothetical protein